MNDDGRTDATLLAATARGDDAAFAVLVRRYVRVATLLAAQFLGDRNDAEDVVQDAFTVVDAHDAMHHFARELDLDSAQQTAIAQILARHQGEVDSTWHAVQPHVRATLDSTTQEIAGVLRPDQLVKYRVMMEAAHPAGHR